MPDWVDQRSPHKPQSKVDRLQFSAWHPLLVRTLDWYLKENQNHPSIGLSSTLAILANIPVPKESEIAVGCVFPLLRQFLAQFPLGEVLKVENRYPAVNVLEDDGLGNPVMIRALKDKPRTRRSKKASWRKVKDSQGGASDSENQYIYRAPRMVQVHECALMSDSDGFAAFAGDIPPAGDEIERSKMDDNCLYVMYRHLFGSYPTLIDMLDTFLHAINVWTKFSLIAGIPAGLTLLSECFDARIGINMIPEDTMATMILCRKWSNWQKIVRMTSRSMSLLSRTSLNVLGSDASILLDAATSFVLSHIRNNICTSNRLALAYNSGVVIDETLIADVEIMLRATNDVTLRLVDEAFSLLSVSKDKSRLSEVGASIVRWTDDPAFVDIVEKVTSSIHARLNLSHPDSLQENRVVFEIFASVVDHPELTNYMLNWCLKLPSGFNKTVKGTELVATLLPYLEMELPLIVKILRRHLSFMSWNDSSRASSFSSGVSSAGSGITSSVASRCAMDLSKALRLSESNDLVVQIASLLLLHCDVVDAEFLLIDAIVPRIKQLCEKCLVKKGGMGEIPVVGEMMGDLKYVLKMLELLAVHLKTHEAASHVIRYIVIPYRDFYFSAFELQDVFVAVCAKATRYAPDVAIATSLSEWMVDRLDAVRRHALSDIWTFVSDSAAKYYKLLLSTLNLIRDIMEENGDVFSSLSVRLLASTSALVDLCFEWIGNSTDEYRNIYRIAEAMSKSMSIHLMLHQDTTDVMDRFTSGLIAALPEEHPSLLLSSIVCSLLDRCLSELPSQRGTTLHIEQESEDDALIGDGGCILITPSRVLLHSELVTSVIDIVKAVLARKPETPLDPVLDFMLQKMCSKLTLIDKHSEEGNEWFNNLCALCDVLIKKQISPVVFHPLFHLMTSLVRRQPNSQQISRLVGYFHSGGVTLKKTVLENLSNLFTGDEVEPATSLSFPQTMANPPLEVKHADDIQKDSVTKDLEEKEKLQTSSSSTIIGAMERFLSAYRSDGETENERRREKKRHLREQVRGASMVSVATRHQPSPPATPLFNGSAATFSIEGVTATDGFSMSFWIKRTVQGSMSPCKLAPLHLISMGGMELSCAFTLNSRGVIHAEVSAGQMRMAREKLKGIVQEGKWTHIALGIQISQSYLTLFGTVGTALTKESIPVIVRLRISSFPITVSFGSVNKKNYHSYLMSTIFGFKGLISHKCAVILSALGCQLSSLSDVKADHIYPNLSTVISHRLAAFAQLALEFVSGDGDLANLVQRIQRAMVFVIRASSAHSYAVSTVQADYDVIDSVSKEPLKMAYLKDFPITWHGRLVQHSQPSVDQFLQTLGGLKLIIYLFVKSVNDCLSAEAQIAAMSLLLKSLRRSAVHTEAATRLKVNSLIARALSSPEAALNEEMMMLLLKHCVRWKENEPLIESTSDLEKNTVLDPYEAVICDPQLLGVLLTRCELWRGVNFSVWRRMIAAVASLVDATTCALYSFNRFQLKSVDLMCRLSNCIYNMVQDPAEFGPFAFESVFVQDVVTLFQSLLGSPESDKTVTHLWHFVFLTHPASMTYIDHKVQGHSEWIAPEFIREEGEGELLGDSKLCKTLKKYLDVLGKDQIVDRWQKGATLMEIRKQFEHELETGWSTDTSSSRIQNVMPDLLKDLMTSQDLSSSAEDVLSFTAPVAETAAENSKKEHEWIIALRAGLMGLMVTVLQNGPDPVLAVLLHDVISWQAIVVLLSQQTDQRIRDAAVDMLEKFMLRSLPFTKISFLRLSGFHVLASQLRGKPMSPQIADSLFSLLLGETVRLGDGLDELHLADLPVDRMSCESLHAIFVAFEEAVPDTALFWNITNALMKIFEHNSQLQQAMTDAHLVDAMVNVLRKIAYLEIKKYLVCDIVTGRPPVSLQLECWSSFASRIIITAVPYNDVRLNAACERFMWLLMLADIQAARDNRYPMEQRLKAQKIIRSQLCQLLHCWMEAVRTVFSDEGKSASATSSVDSLYNDAASTSTTSTPSEEYEYIDDVMTTPEKTPNEGPPTVAAFIAGSFANLREKINHMGPISRRNLKCQYVRRRGPAPLATIESLNERMLFALDTNATIFSILTPTESVTEEEENLFHFFLYFMLSSWKKEPNVRLNSPRTMSQSVWQRVVLMCRDRVRVLLAQMVAFVLFPAHRKMYEAALATRTDIAVIPNWNSEWIEEKRRLIVRALAHELQYKQTLSSLLNVNLDYEYALCLGLYELAFLSPMRPELEDEIDKMVRFLSTCKVGSPFEKFTADSLNNLTTDEILSMHSYSQHRKGVMQQLRSKMEMIRDGEQKLTAIVGEMAMNVTCEVVEEQNLPRKIFIRATKTAIGEFVEAERILTQIVRELCHPEACGFEVRHWPVGWALDPTEGPMRERRRLMPYYYPFDTRFFKANRKEAVARNIDEQPLERLLQNAEGKRSVMEKAAIDEPIRLYMDVTVLRGTFECAGELLVGETHLHFVGQTAKSTQKGTECSVMTLSWRFDQLVEMQTRNHLLKDVALEIFISNGDTYLIVFSSNQKRQLFQSHMVDLKLSYLFPNKDQMLQAVMQSWRHGSTTNFEYLMQLNKLAGRSFNDLMQYPVFPFVLSDYSSAVLDLANPSSFRNLSKPMAIQDKRMEAHYIANFNCLQAECARTNVDAGPLHFGPYHYGSHYSNSGIVVHYLVRLSPFTQIALEYQDNNFDIPDRLFNSIESTWRLSSSESTTDFKELIPEFFCLPEFLENNDQLDLGVRQGGDQVAAVKLPVWAPEKNPRLFVLMHRQALEATIVTQNLHLWIDLIFGYKQTGKAALDALNVFHPATYLGHLNADELSDELSQSALRTMVRSYGQMPMQVLQAPHQPHLVAGKDKREKIRPSAPIASVQGIRWGDYVGSAEQDQNNIQTVLSVKSQKSDRLGRVVTLPDGAAAGVPRGTLLLCKAATEKDLVSSPKLLEAMATISWSFSDSVIRFKLMKPQLGNWTNIIELNGLEVCTMEYSATNRIFFVAFTSGLIRVYDLDFGPEGITNLVLRSDLLGHHSAVRSLCVCDEYSIAISGSSDGKVIVWDTNRLSFVRVLRPSGRSAVTALCASKTSADIAVVSQQGYGSKVELFTVNGVLVGEVVTETTVICMAMTNQNEGTAVNCMALGMQDGHVRLIEMWCLTAVRDIVHLEYQDAIISVEYVNNGRKLFVILASGRVLCWQCVTNLPKIKSPQFQIINPFSQ